MAIQSKPQLITPEQGEDLIDIQNISLQLNQNSVFEGLSLTIARGEKLALLGGSGVGKSSLLKLIAGIHQPSSGLVFNKSQRVGYVFQEPRLLPWLTVAQNIGEVMKAYGTSQAKITHKVSTLLEQVGLGQCHQYYPHQLSGGMAQRVSIARAFAIEPDLLLLDEPFSSLDSRLTHQLSTLLQELLTPKISMVYVSHQVEEVLPLTQRCLVLQANNRFDWHCVEDLADREYFLNQIYANEVF
ncbi:MAG: ABC transporter ATP-binding protein [Colwellia sp.]|nr:ABC transporter ATP-binding protein [Colwellia sp.]